MPIEIEDDGKVWLRGTARPVYAIRVGDRVVIPGVEEGSAHELWISETGLCADIHDPQKSLRVARCFPLETEGDTPGTLFNGFTKTKHADIRALTPESPGIKETRFEGADYERVKDLASREFWKQAGLEG